MDRLQLGNPVPAAVYCIYPDISMRYCHSLASSLAVRDGKSKRNFSRPTRVRLMPDTVVGSDHHNKITDMQASTIDSYWN